MHRYWRKALAALCAVALIGGVSSCGASKATINLKDVEIENYRWASFLSAYGAYKTTQYGEVLLIRDDGSYDIAQTGYMENGQLSWSSDGLFISDELQDHKLSSAHVQDHVDSKKRTGVADSLVALSDGRWVGAYNVGFTSDGYDEQIVVSDGTDINTSRVNEHYLTLSSCGTDVYGLTTDKDANQKAYTHMQQLLNQGEFVNNRVTADDSPWGLPAIYPGEAPCKDGKVYALSFYGKDDDNPSDGSEQATHLVDSAIQIGQGVPFTLALEEFDTHSGTHNVMPLLLEDGTPLAQKFLEQEPHQESSMTYSYTNLQNAIIGNTLYVVFSSGHIVGIDLATGICRIVSDELAQHFHPTMDNAYIFHASIHDHYMHVMAEENGASFDHPQILVFDLNNGQLVNAVSLQGLAKAVPSDMSLWDFEVNPTMSNF